MKSNNPRLSIITVTKNAREALFLTKESLLGQDFMDFEWIVIDGASSDGTSRDFENLNILNLKFISEPDDGLYDAMNKGIKNAKGDIIGILNANDTYLDGTLSLVSKVARENPDSDIFYGGVSIDGQGQYFLSHEALEKRMIYHPAIFIRKTVYEKVGNFDTRYKIAADYDFILRAKKRNFNFHAINQAITNYQSGGMSSKHVFTSVMETLFIQLKHPSLSNVHNVYIAIKSLGAILFK
jgi:glycosyltransferase involved in cell wall biosynthesis